MDNKTTELVVLTEIDLKEKIYSIRGLKVMLDFDLAEVYGYSTKRLNEQVNRNLQKFPSDFLFRLNNEEVKDLVRSQFATSRNIDLFKGQSGGIRYLPYAFTEQGVYMLMTILKGELATEQSKNLIRLFKGMKDYIMENKDLVTKADILQMTSQISQNRDEINSIKSHLVASDEDLKQLNKKLGKVSKDFIDEDKHKEILILDGQKWEAEGAYMRIYKQAKMTIDIIDNYLGRKTLSLLKDTKPDIVIRIFSDNLSSSPLTKKDLETFSSEYKLNISLRCTNDKFHDRYIFIDLGSSNEKIYHCGASSKDAGKRITTITEIEYKDPYKDIIEKIKGNPILRLN